MAFSVTVTWHNAGPHTIWAKLAERLGRDPTNDKWGPAGCIKLDAADRFLFFGWASS